MYLVFCSNLPYWWQTSCHLGFYPVHGLYVDTQARFGFPTMLGGTRWFPSFLRTTGGRKHDSRTRGNVDHSTPSETGPGRRRSKTTSPPSCSSSLHPPGNATSWHPRQLTVSDPCHGSCGQNDRSPAPFRSNIFRLIYLWGG